MKKFARILICLALALTLVFTLVACDLDKGDDNGNNNGAGDPPAFGSEYDSITIAEAIETAKQAGQSGTTDEYIIVGTVKKVSNATYGEMTVEDATGELYVYGSMAEDGTYFDSMADRPVDGDKIALKGKLMTYNDTPQMATKSSKAIILAFEHVTVEPDVNLDDYTAHNIASVRALEKGAKVKVDGVVARITYANGKKPNGFILVDESASIYVYDGTIAQQVSVGNRVEIAGVKTLWILETEQNNAALYGYKGACQIDSAVLVSNDKGNNAFDTSWIETKSVKEILNSDITSNITTLVYKTTALVEKKEGTGFTNYYFFDLDGTTGTYTYTQCNGSDFTWLDKFDGKICTVYITALNAKSTPAECFFRFLPVAVEEIENFSFAEEDVPAFALEYGVNDLISTEPYGSNPKVALPLTYSNEIIGAEGVTFEYSSSNTEIATIEDGDGVKVLNVLKNGSAEITVKATYKTYSATITKTVTFAEAKEYVTPTVAEIIAEEDGTLVQLRGVVLSSLVNRDGFYLADSTGIIAVLANSETLSQLKPGDEVVVEGYKIHFNKTSSLAGQCAIVGSITGSTGTSDTKLLANYHGENNPSVAPVITDVTVDDLYNLDPSIDFTTNVYKLNAKAVFEQSQYYTSLKIMGESGNTKLSVYCSGAGQYSWLKAYDGQVVEMELAVCNWNTKGYYTVCVISVTVDGVTVYNTLNFDN